MKYTLMFSVLLFLSLRGAAQLNKPANYEGTETFRFPSETVGDTFTVSIQIPLEYPANTAKRYPIVFVMDGDFYFPTMAPLLRQYELTGLLPPMILVGIGYGDFQKMDSLRVRDFLYPAPLESDEMTAPGGGRNFYRFITEELLTHLETNLRVDTAQRTLMGHSFGGYFALYALLQQAEDGKTFFSNIIAASPTLWYHDFYIFQLPDKLAADKPKNTLNIILTAGSLENSAWTLNPVHKLTVAFKNESIPDLYLDTFIYNFLDHMDTGQLSFVKGLQQFYSTPPTQ